MPNGVKSTSGAGFSGLSGENITINHCQKEELMKGRKLYFIIFALLIAIIGIYWMGRREPGNAKTTPVPMAKIPKLKKDLLLGTTIKVPGKEKNSYWQLKVAELSSLAKIGKMTGITGDFFRDEKPVYHVTARFGEVFWQNGTIRLREEVEFVSNDGRKIVAGEFQWDPVKNRVIAAKKVVLSSADITVTTEKLTANPQVDRVTFAGETRIVYHK
jgi:LPS export ABC transporter protein LptC